MKVKVIMEVEVPDGTESCYESDDQCTALGAEIAENVAPMVKSWLCKEIIPVDKFEKVKIEYRHFYPAIYND